MPRAAVASTISSATLNAPAFFLSALFLAWIGTFVVFAIIRTLTGVSIQRVGYLCIKRISYQFRGVKLELRRAGVQVHRPTFAQPTWISVVLSDIQISVDLKKEAAEEHEEVIVPKLDKIKVRKRGAAEPAGEETTSQKELKVKRRRSLQIIQAWTKKAREIHRWLKWIKLVDIMVTNTNISVGGVGSVQIGSMAMSVDVRKKTAHRQRIFDHCSDLKDEERPIEWIFTSRSVLLFLESKEPIEILDHSILNLYGVLDAELARDLAMSLKFGRINVPLDEIMECLRKLKGPEKVKAKPPVLNKPKRGHVSLSSVMEEMSMPGSRTETIVEMVMESKEMLQGFLRGVKEIQFSINHLSVSKSLAALQPRGTPLQVLLGMKELGLDIHRLDQSSPAHRMYFSPKDIAHQALLAAIAISVSVDDGCQQDRILYVPMVTMTSRTTLLSKTIQLAEKTESDRNANIMFANMVVTSPSIDLEPRHLPLVVAYFQSRTSRPTAPVGHKTQLISRLLPKASIKFSVQEPVIRIVLPGTDRSSSDPADLDMLISSLSSISLDVDASHEAEGQSEYALQSTLRLTSHQLYYQAAESRQRHDLLQIDTFDLRLQVKASPEIQVAAHASLETFTLTLTRPEIVQGLKQMVEQFHHNIKPKKATVGTADKPNFLRGVPLWLENFRFDGTDFSVEVAGVDTQISEFTRGIAIQLESLAMEYKCKRGGESHFRPTRRRTVSRAITAALEDGSPKKRQPSSKHVNPTDGRKLTCHIRGLEGFMVDSPESWEEESFFKIPHVDLSFSTNTDAEGPVLHVHCNSKSIFFHYSLYRHYTVIVATTVLREAFGRPAAEPRMNGSVPSSPKTTNLLPGNFDMDMMESPATYAPEFISIDVKIGFVQVKSTMPAEPPMMLEMYGLDAGRHRWGMPYFKSKNFRIYAESPTVKKAWARLISMRALRVDLREPKRKFGGAIVEDRSVDLTADAIRVAIPHQLILYQITDNIVNTTKACQQMHHRFKTGTNEYILEKQPEGPKKMPRICLRTKALLLELEDDLFETKLGLIYRYGLIEQKNRLAMIAAYDAKVASIEKNARNRRQSWETSRTGGDFVRPRGRTQTWRDNTRYDPRSRSRGGGGRARSKSKATAGKNTMRYDPQSAAAPTDNATVSADVAWQKLQVHFSVAWIRRMKSVTEQHAKLAREARESFWGHDEFPRDEDDEESILSLPTRPALMGAQFNDVDIIIDKPSFPMDQLPQFLHRVGKGLPEDTQFALLVPLNVKLEFSEARVTLRDYPLPFIHIPHMPPSHSGRTPAWQLTTDFVLAEELRGPESMRKARVDIVPPMKMQGGSQLGGFSIDVMRTVAAVKSYSDIKVAINASYPTRITWCTSYQPAIQEMMMVFETFTKPHVDPSERTGFWDKIRLILHSQITLAWEGDGDVHLTLKGSRDPYKVTGDGAGFVLCWRGNVQWDIARDDDPSRLMKIDSEEFLLAIPDFSSSVRQHDLAAGVTNDDKSEASADSYTYQKGATFKKVAMKLSGKCRWLVGLMFEQEITNEEDWRKRERSFEFIPHYMVTLRSPETVHTKPGQVYDAFRGFRSHHLHMSLAIESPVGEGCTPTYTAPADSYNAIHLTPRFFTHFFSWWNLFSGAMSLPIRNGTLWPLAEKSSKKFGRHLATIKYKLCLSPLFISHIYKHNDKDDAGTDFIAATGLKARLETFLMDIHQRREEALPGSSSTAMKINQAELDFHSADIRAVSGATANTPIQDLMKQANEFSQHLGDMLKPHSDFQQFTIPDGDLGWVDMDDFVELDWVLQSENTPKTKIMPLAFAPRFTYFRQTDHSFDDSHQESPSPFGNEPSHDCIMSQKNDPREIQCELVQSRLERVNHQMVKNKEDIDELAALLKVNPENGSLRTQSEQLIEQSSILYNKLHFLQSMLRQMSSNIAESDKVTSNGLVEEKPDYDDSDSESDTPGMDSSPFADYAGDFDNRFVVHNMQAKWNNSLRNIILKYIHQVGQRRGFTYYMSRRAIKFILDICEEQAQRKGRRSGSIHSTHGSHGPSSEPDEEGETDSIEDRIQALLDDDVKLVVADNEAAAENNESGAKVQADDDLAGDVAEDYVPMNSYHVRLIAPQIQLQSEKNTSTAVWVAAEGMQLQVVSIMDRERIGDDVSGLVQRRFALNLDNTQFFVSNHKAFIPAYMSLHSANSYGAPKGSNWPPWVPLESMFDYLNNPVGFSRVVERTSATLRYDKHNSLRLKYSDKVSDGAALGQNATPGPMDSERRVDNVLVAFPRVEASCDSKQYFAMYIIVLDLLLYSEPLEKLRTEKLEKIMLASDFSDLSGAPAQVEELQCRIRSLEEIKAHFQLWANQLDLQGWEDRLQVDRDLAYCEEELFFLMKAITTAQRRNEDRASQSQGVLRWYISASEIIWHLIRDKSDPLMDLRLKEASFERVDVSDGSNYNTVEVESMIGQNLLPNAAYPEILAPFFDKSRTESDLQQQKMLRVYWHMLEAIAGIPVMDHFEVNLFPLKIQLEREIGEKVFKYIFPGLDKGAGGDNNFSPFLVHSMQPLPDPSEEMEVNANAAPRISFDESSASDLSVDLRLRPTLSLSGEHHQRRGSHSQTHSHVNNSKAERPKTSSGASMFSFSNGKGLVKKRSNDALSVMTSKSQERPTTSSSNAGMSGGEKKKGFFHRHGHKKSEDDLSQMMSRASNFMHLAYVKIPSVALCLSYKGRGDKNLEDIHELVFRMPTLEYRGKIWSNLDLALRLKKDIIRALLSHTGAIIQNKFTNHRPSRNQPNVLRMMANNDALGTNATGSEVSSTPNDSSQASSTSTTLNYSPSLADSYNDETVRPRPVSSALSLPFTAAVRPSTSHSYSSYASERPSPNPSFGSNSSFGYSAAVESGNGNGHGLGLAPAFGRRGSDGSMSIRRLDSEKNGSGLFNGFGKAFAGLGRKKEDGGEDRDGNGVKGIGSRLLLGKKGKTPSSSS